MVHGVPEPNGAAGQNMHHAKHERMHYTESFRTSDIQTQANGFDFEGKPVGSVGDRSQSMSERIFFSREEGVLI